MMRRGSEIKLGENNIIQLNYKYMVEREEWEREKKRRGSRIESVHTFISCTRACIDIPKSQR
jgi:hypothetical protein